MLEPSQASNTSHAATATTPMTTSPAMTMTAESIEDSIASNWTAVILDRVEGASPSIIECDGALVGSSSSSSGRVTPISPLKASMAAFSLIEEGPIFNYNNNAPPLCNLFATTSTTTITTQEQRQRRDRDRLISGFATVPEQMHASQSPPKPSNQKQQQQQQQQQKEKIEALLASTTTVTTPSESTLARGEKVDQVIFGALHASKQICPYSDCHNPKCSRIGSRGKSHVLTRRQQREAWRQERSQQRKAIMAAAIVHQKLIYPCTGAGAVRARAMTQRKQPWSRSSRRG